MFELRDGTRIIGQFSAVQIRWLAKAGRLKPNMEIRNLHSGGWNPITDVKDLQIAAPCPASSKIAPPPAYPVQAVNEGRAAAEFGRNLESDSPPWGIDVPPLPIAQNRDSSDATNSDRVQHGPSSSAKQEKKLIQLCLVLAGLCFVLLLVRSTRSTSTIDRPGVTGSQDVLLPSLTVHPESISSPSRAISAPRTPMSNLEIKAEHYYRDRQGAIMSETEAEQRLEQVRSRIRSMPDNLERAYMEGFLRSIEEEWARIKEQGPVDP